MVRLYDTQAKFLTLLLFYLRDSMALDPADIVHYYLEREVSIGKRNGKATAELLARTANDLKHSYKDLITEDMISSLFTQLYEKDREHDSDLVETIVQALGLEYGGNRLVTRSGLDALRKAVLLPDELRKLKETLAKKELHCSCGHAFGDGEITTASLTRDGVTLNCARCRLPSFVVCFKKPDCECLVRIDERDLTRMTRAVCHEHRVVEKKEGEADGADVQQQLNDPLRTFQRFAVGAAARPGRIRAANNTLRDMLNNANTSQWQAVPVPPPQPAPPSGVTFIVDEEEGVDEP